MFIASAILVAQMSLRIAPAPTPVTPNEMTATLEGGVGELTVVATPIDTGTVALGATRVPVLSIEASASCDAPVSIEEIMLYHEGLGDGADIDGVFIGADYRRVSRSARVQGDATVRLRFQKVTVSPCEVLPLTVYINLSRDAAPAGEHALTLRSPLDVVSTAENVTLSSHTSTRSTVVASSHSYGAITVRFLSVPSRIRYGRTETLSRIQISADSASSQVLKSITLTNEENARDYDFVDLRLENTRGEPVTRLMPHMDGRTVTFFFEPTYILEKGQTRVFLLKSKVNSSVRKKVRFTMEEEADLVASPYRLRR